MKKHTDVSNEIEQRIHDCAGRILSGLSEECRNELKDIPREVVAGIHCAALHCVLNIVAFVGNAVNATNADLQGSEPYPDQVRQIKANVDAFNSALASWNPTPASPKDSGGIQRKKGTRKAPEKATDTKQSTFVATPVKVSSDSVRASEG